LPRPLTEMTASGAPAEEEGGADWTAACMIHHYTVAGILPSLIARRRL
jgi:hypothetical protein